MNRKDKIAYLERYKKLKDKFEYLDNKLKDPDTFNYHHVKTTVHQSLEERIYERDKAYEDMIYAHIEINRLVEHDLLLGYKYTTDMYDYEIAKMLGITMKQFNRQLRESLDRLEIK
ncbi:hypothetical protein [Candidatus Stoquefichus sp. SB1]|uniref:hypothetical protein n=1 Tax=Candidatus Stoquefichus sp. SB1 TaxID=1658109 RepID=UPI00067F5B30|nr:hypothetical protein [Candidatus Stoquefichus sp. SB1]